MNPSDSNRRHAVSFYLTIRSPRPKRSRFARPPTPPPTCEESIHYPVFNPQDPRHNPALRTSSWLEDGYGLHQAQSPPGSVRWMQSLPRRSLRRARSGLLALRSGIHRRPVHTGSNGNDDISRLWSSSDSAEGSSDNQEGHMSSTISEASTEEDIEFGTDLYRTDCKSPSDLAVQTQNYPFDCPSYNSCTNQTRLPTSTSGTPEVLLAEIATNSRPMVDTANQTTEEENSETCNDNDTPPDANIGRMTPVLPENIDPASPSYPSDAACVINTPEMAMCSNKDDYSSTLNTSDGLDAFAPMAMSHTLDPCVDTHSTSSSSSHKPKSILADLPRVEDIEEPQVGQAPSDHEQETLKNTDAMARETEPPTVLEGAKSQDQDDDAQSNLDFENDIGEAGYVLSLANYNDNDVNDTIRIELPTRSNSSSEIGSGFAPISFNPWLPIEKDDLASLSSWRDEYFLVDGKSNDLHPDRGDNPTKTDRISGDGGIYSGPGLDRSRSVRAQEIPEIIGPVRPVRVQPPRSLRTERDGSDSTDEYLATYSLFQRHYFP